LINPDTKADTVRTAATTPNTTTASVTVGRLVPQADMLVENVNSMRRQS
jgi:hypothetical protein|tara:strand:- start:2541 stop:2687 length:147 start_codon:yes stop_codon:yes gene_type:complete